MLPAGFKRLRTCIQRPGVPVQCNLATCRFLDKSSPPPRDDDKVGGGRERGRE